MTQIKRRQIFLLILTGASALAALGVPYLHPSPSYTQDSTPLLSAPALVRSLFLFQMSVFLVRIIPEREEWPRALRGEAAIALAFIALAVAIVVLMILHPTDFRCIASESGPVENASVVGWFVAAVVAFRAAAASTGWKRRWAVVFGVGLFLCGGEECSWGQRFFRFSTPALFDANLAHEVNIHNFATDAFEEIFYFATFAWLGFATPWLALLPEGWQRFEPVRPGRAELVAASQFCAINHDMWNRFSTQVAFFACLALLSRQLVDERASPWRAINLLAIVAMVLVQGAFIEYFPRDIAYWWATEYKELVIALAFLPYATRMALTAR